MGQNGKKTATKLVESGEKNSRAAGLLIQLFPQLKKKPSQDLATKIHEQGTLVKSGKVVNRAILERKTPGFDPLQADQTQTRLELNKEKNLAVRVPGQVQPKVSQRVDKKKDRSNLFLVVASLVFLSSLALTWQLMSGTPGRSGNSLRYELQRKAEFYRDQLGWKLNRERIDVEYDNFKTAPKLDPETRKVAEPDMMKGLPLKGEQHHHMYSRDRLRPANPNSPDARIQYGLQEEQHAREWEKEAQQEYMRDFIKNAERAGYRVKIDVNGNVEVVGRRPSALPGQGGESDASRPGAVR